MSGIQQLHSSAQRAGNTKQPASRRHRASAITLNNYTEQDIAQMHSYFQESAIKYIIAKEVGRQGTPHLQCYARWKKQISFNVLQKALPRAHIEAARCDEKVNATYCSKDGEILFKHGLEETIPIITRKEKVLEQYKDAVWRPWQQEIIDIIHGPKNDRTINWYWEPVGNAGKSWFSRYLASKYECVFGTGKATDIFNQVLKWQQEEKKYIDAGIDRPYDPDIILLDIPRNSLGFINYSALEKLKDGLLYSGKYEGGVVLFVTNPHVIVFANAPPDLDQMSEDRWNIVKIELPEPIALAPLGSKGERSPPAAASPIWDGISINDLLEQLYGD